MYSWNLSVNVAIVMLACMPIMADAQDTSAHAETTLTLPPHVNDPARRLIAVDPIKMIGMFHAFFTYAVTNHLAVGGALQTPTGFLMGATGLGIQPEVTFNLLDDPFDGPYIGATAWINYLTYHPIETDGGHNIIELPAVTELIMSAGPVIGIFVESPIGAVRQLVVGAEYVFRPGTEYAAGAGTQKVGWSVYISGRAGIRW